MAQTTVSIRMDDDLKKSFDNVCNELGLSMTTAITMLAKKAMLREIGTHHQDSRYALLEDELLQLVNASGIGPAGYGGKTTALSLNIETYPTHIAGMPVAVSICCHVSRHKEARL